MRIFLILIFICSFSAAYACFYDQECGFGKSCVKPQGNLAGTCQANEGGSATDPMGAGSQEASKSCHHNAECPQNTTCSKNLGEIKGVCK